MSSRLLRRLVPVAALALLVVPLPASATHSVDEHSPNMVHVFNSKNPGTVNSDIAFWGNLMALGNYRGFRLFDITKPEAPVLLSDFRCNGGQGDVSFYKARNRLLLFRSIDTPQTTSKCEGSSNTAGAIKDDQHFEGIRIIDVTDPTAPKFVKGVYTDCGSHTHTTIPDDRNQRAIIYVSSYPLSPTGLGPQCPEVPPAPGTTIHGKISIIAVPDANPAAAEVIKEQPLHQHTIPAVGPPQAVPGAVACHDITAFTDPKIHTAAAACLTEGQLWDISDPANPCTLDPRCHTHVHNELVNIWHSSTFTWDGQIVLFGDEWAGAEAHGCDGPTDPRGNIWFYRNVPPGSAIAPPLGRYMIPRPQPATEFCTLHNFNVVPVNDNEAYIGVSASYEGGTTVFDFSGLKNANPAASEFTAPIGATELAHWDEQGTDGNGNDDVWSSYWYNDYIWANGGLDNRTVRAQGDRGLDVYKLLRPDGQQFRARKFHHENPQTQEGFQTLGG